MLKASKKTFASLAAFALLASTPLAPALAGDGALQETSTSPLIKSWARQIGKQLSNSMVEPSRFSLKGEYGQVEYRLRVDRDGRVENAQLARSSGFSNLDRAAKKTIEKMKQLEPLPAGVSGDYAIVEMNLAYLPPRGATWRPYQRKIRDHNRPETDMIDLADMGTRVKVQLVNSAVVTQ